MRIDADMLLKTAAEAKDRAYAPYSRFKVGAALLDAQGRVYPGCNVENAAYAPTNCAERTALFGAIASGASPKQFAAIALIGDTQEPLSPCGVCRQVMIELCPPDMPVIMGSAGGRWTKSTVAELLPDAFHPDVLKEEQP
ncbi:cytidine deaminase [Ferviditalea candida]|uniref:Cytidine deaminase n=1 Tax=Ferviditalea candida TaxID=3108399 RepID=A0ABU5ZHB2_9BACL|nr:cytidine deaminase [Paenibacillaceae bacterium T2]